MSDAYYDDNDDDDDNDNKVAPTKPFKELTRREREIARLLALGATNGEIVQALGIGIKTVDTHRGHLMRKLNLRNNVELARAALRNGFVSLEDSLPTRQLELDLG